MQVVALPAMVVAAETVPAEAAMVTMSVVMMVIRMRCWQRSIAFVCPSSTQSWCHTSPNGCSIGSSGMSVDRNFHSDEISESRKCSSVVAGMAKVEGVVGTSNG